ncbi:MAG: 3-phosphoserine/phosphohydroxythreonine transaminase [Proteobacteria bacterium]|nr:3-phosphoserine/phosphohydroxythreonine transaminase [Pseudomonadota bacterium]
MARAWNFVAGPAGLPESVIRKAQEALWDIGTGAGILEVSHRSAFFDRLMYDLEAQFRRIGNIPDDYDVLFMQGGATLQFCQIPAILTHPGDHIDCIHTGFWTRNAMRDAAFYTDIHYAYDGAAQGFEHIPDDSEISFSENPRYVYYCANNSFMGTEWQKPPATSYPLVADMSSNMYSRPIDMRAHCLIFASAQKNLGIAGLCVMIVKHDFLEACQPEPRASMFNYRRLVENRSMLNTPPTFALFVMKLMLDWIDAQGGLAALEIRNREKAAIIRDAIDSTGGFFRHVGEPQCRSLMNISFRSASRELDEMFVSEAEAAQMLGLRGHRETGGLRASVFNAFPVEGCRVLAEFIREFARVRG